MEIVQFQTHSWFSPRELFLEDPTISTSTAVVFCNILSGAMAREYLTYISLTNYEHNLQVYKWRFQTHGAALPIYNIELGKVVRTEAAVSVLCEKLFFRVGEVFDKLELGEKLYVLAEVVRGSAEVGGRLGWFRVGEGMVGLNRKGRVRVWLNQNHAVNEPQYLCATAGQQFTSILKMFGAYCSKNHHFRVFIDLLEKEGVNYEHFQQYLHKFMCQSRINLPAEVGIQKIVSLCELEPKNRYSQFSSRPSLTLKNGNDSTELTLSHKQCSLNCKDSGIKSVESSNIPKYSLKTPNNRVRKGKSTRNILGFSNKQQLSCLQDKTNHPQTKYLPPLSGQSLSCNSKLYKSIVLESDILSPTLKAVDARTLQKLGRIGKFCESTTAEELILQQFKGIYE